MSGLRKSRSAPRRRPKARPAALHLVSLMDIFTILVFFLLVNSSDVEVLDIAPDVRLPDSLADRQPDAKLVVSVSGGEIRLNGTPVATVADAASDAGIDGLASALAGHPGQGTARVTIMADRDMPYALLAKILKTCEGASHPAIAFAVNQTGSDGNST